MIKKITAIFFYFWDNQFFRFIFIGGVNTLFGYSVFSLLVYCEVHYSLALFFATILGVIFNFKTIGIIVFKNGKNNRVIRFIAVYVILYFLNLVIIWVLKNMNTNIYVAGGIAVLPVAFIGFYLNKRFVFGKE